MGLSCLSKSVELKVKNDSREHDDFQDNASLQRNIFTCLITQINCVKAATFLELVDKKVFCFHFLENKQVKLGLLHPRDHISDIMTKE